MGCDSHGRFRLGHAFHSPIRFGPANYKNADPVAILRHALDPHFSGRGHFKQRIFFPTVDFDASVDTQLRGCRHLGLADQRILLNPYRKSETQRIHFHRYCFDIVTPRHFIPCLHLRRYQGKIETSTKRHHHEVLCHRNRFICVWGCHFGRSADHTRN
jgi:hypothetical protein